MEMCVLFDNRNKREWRRLHNKELFSSQNITRMIKSIKIRCAGQKAIWETGEVHTGF
jgi:hypothetical protein